MDLPIAFVLGFIIGGNAGLLIFALLNMAALESDE